jgi:hypothetical protein
MQGIMETIFDVFYLSTVLFLGISMFRGSKPGSDSRLFGIMAIVLGAGDAFHLIPRAYALLTDGLASHAAALGIGKLITSITMTFFYLILYQIWKKRYAVKNTRTLTTIFYSLAAVRIALSLMPQNAWLSADAPLSWGIYRNMPFAVMGLIIIWIFFDKARKTNDRPFSKMWLAVTLSFAFYVPVVLWADRFSLVGTLMIPKTLAYVWVVCMGWKEYQRTLHPIAQG